LLQKIIDEYRAGRIGHSRGELVVAVPCVRSRDQLLLHPTLQDSPARDRLEVVSVRRLAYRVVELAQMDRDGAGDIVPGLIVGVALHLLEGPRARVPRLSADDRLGRMQILVSHDITDPEQLRFLHLLAREAGCTTVVVAHRSEAFPATDANVLYEEFILGRRDPPHINTLESILRPDAAGHMYREWKRFVFDGCSAQTIDRLCGLWSVPLPLPSPSTSASTGPVEEQQSLYMLYGSWAEQWFEHVCMGGRSAPASARPLLARCGQDTEAAAYVRTWTGDFDCAAMWYIVVHQHIHVDDTVLSPTAFRQLYARHLGDLHTHAARIAQCADAYASQYPARTFHVGVRLPLNLHGEIDAVLSRPGETVIMELKFSAHRLGRRALVQAAGYAHAYCAAGAGPRPGAAICVHVLNLQTGEFVSFPMGGVR